MAVLAGATAIDGESASATTFCVPAFSTACPNSGGNFATADVEKAMSLQDSDGQADRIEIAAGTFIENGDFEPAGGGDDRTYEPHGSDPLTIVGAGPAATILTSAGSGNVFLFNFNGAGNSRSITMRDLTARIPASFGVDQGSAFQLTGDTLDNVDIVSLNKGSDGVSSAVGAGNVFRNGEIRGEAGGSVDDALRSSSDGGSLLVEDAKAVGASWALQASGPTSSLTARRVTVVGARTYGAIVTRGSLTVENSVMTIDDGIGLYVSASASASSLSADHVTIVNFGSGDNPAIEMKKESGVGNATATVSNSILRGFAAGYEVDAAAGPGIGVATLTARYSNFSAAGTSSGVLDIDTGNIDADPQLAADLSLPAGSPSVDAGDPAAGLVTDFLGAPRPNDGNGDGIAVRDQGAFEYQRPASPGGDPPGNGGGGAADPTPLVGSTTPDVTPPQATIAKGPGGKLAQGKAKFVVRSDEAGSRFECKLDGKKVSRCNSPKRYANLAPGRHTFKVWAIDAAGNKSPKPAKRRFSVPAPA